MAFFEAGVEVPGHGFTPREQVADEAWGEIWRVEHSDGRRLILVAYTTVEGDAMFAEAESNLRRWNELAAVVCPKFMKIVEISQSAIPYLLVADPGHGTLREYVNKLGAERMKLDRQGRLATQLAAAVSNAEAYNVVPLGITPDTVWLHPDDTDHPWKILPVGPGAASIVELLAGGRYFPEEAKRPSASLSKMHADCYSIVRLWLEVFQGTWDPPEQPLEKIVPYAGLRFVLESTLFTADGRYTEPANVATGIERWTQKQLKDDVAAYEEAQRDRSRTPTQQWMARNGPTLAKVLGAVAVVVLLAGGVWFVIKYQPFGRSRSTLHPTDTAELYFQALLGQDGEAAAKFVVGDATEATTSLMKLLEEMDYKGSIDGLAEADVRSTGHGTTHIVEGHFRDQGGRKVGVVTVFLQQRENSQWVINGVFFKRHWA